MSIQKIKDSIEDIEMFSNLSVNISNTLVIANAILELDERITDLATSLYEITETL